MSHNYWVGGKIRLRPIEETDAETDYYRITQDYDSEAERLGDAIDFPLSQSQMKKIIEEAANKERENHDFWFVIETLDGEVVGNLFTFNCNRRMGTFKLGLDIGRKYQRKGYGFEAVIMALRYYFHELRYQKVNTGVYSFNAKSLAFHEKLGFKKEGVLRNMVYTGGKYYDEIYFGMTKDEFDSRYTKED